MGAAWVRKVLSPEDDRANFELEPEKVALPLEVNLDPRQTMPTQTFGFANWGRFTGGPGLNIR